jgi:endonuclease/exonuclease/phosphatase family metal-dependent hydrolase
LILQEVTDTAWQYFLSDNRLRQKYPYVSAPKTLPLPNIRNIVLLSAIPFKAHYLPLVTAHKSALIIDIEGLTIAGVHLHAGLHEEKLALKLKELSKLIAYLESTRNPVIIAGDFNIPSIPREYTAALPKIQELLARYTDAWMEKPTGCGDTFTPDTNRFAKEGATVSYPQRHDRIYFSKKAGILVERTELFVIPLNEEDLGSDHWGFSVDIRINLDEKLDHDNTTEIISMDVPETTWTDEEMRQTLTDANQVPDDHHNRNVRDALDLLRSIFDPIKQLLPFELQVVGSFALGVHTKSSDLDLMAVSTISQKVFWVIFLQHLQRYKLSDPLNRVKVLRIIRNAKTPMMELLIDNYKFEIQYCPAGRLLPLYLLLSILLISDGIKFPHYPLRQICYISLHLR